ncbi:MAG: regulatory protein RecX [Burkholderiales bacterium]|jgi:regulatory protein|nr:regulatory protein RecX [Burkholderiales bacterium]
MLARREYGRAELRARLLARGVDEAGADEALDELVRRGLLSDERYAEALVARKAGRWGRRAIAHEMKEKGVDAAAASSALAALGQRDEVEEALALWRRRYDAPPGDPREKARQLRFLLSRGYPASVAMKVLRRVGVDAGEEDL